MKETDKQDGGLSTGENVKLHDLTIVSSPHETETFLPGTSKHIHEDEDQKTKFFKIDAKFVPVKLAYFFMGGALSSFIPFVHLHFYQLGLSAIALGIISSIRPVMAMVSTPLWGSIADKFHLHRFLMFCCVIGLCTSPLCLIFIPVANQDICSGKEFNGSKINVFESSTNNPFMNSLVSSPIDELDAFYPDNVQTEYVVVDNDVTHFTAPQESATSNHGDSLRTFLTAFCSMLFVYMFVINWHVLIDSTTVELCNKYKGSSYGQQRYLASLSVVVMSLIAGFLMEWSERRGAARGDVCYNSRYFMPLVLTCISCAFIALFPLSKIEVISKARTKSFYKSFFKLLKRLNVFRFLLVLIITGASKGVIGTYLFLFLEDLNASKIVIGLCPVFECLAEIPCMYISQRLISKLGSSAVMTIGVFGHVIRQLANSFPTNPVFILPIEALHGVTFGFLWPSLVIYANQIAPEGMSSTMQAMVTAFDSGLGELIGILIGGIVYDRFGPRVLFRGMAACCAVLLLIMLIPIKDTKRKEEEKV